MVPQKTRASAASTKGFTLVELIVVITILAILGTIGFLSLQGYSGQSRDSKRTSDLRSLSTAITTQSTAGIALTSMANAATTSAMMPTGTATIGGSGSVLGTDYVAGVPNYTVLGLNASNFKDPLGSEYRVGTSTRDNGVFQVAAKLEPSGANTNGVATVTGNYVPRTAASFTANGSSGSTAITGLQSTSVGLIKKGDVIFLTGPGVPVTVSSVSGDGLSLTLTSTLTGTVTAVKLGNVTAGVNEPLGLIATSSGGTTAVVDQSGSTLPY